MEKHRTTLGEIETSTVGRSGDSAYQLTVQNATVTAPLALSHQVINSEGHPHQLLGRYQGNIGGPFTSHKVEIDLNTEYGNIKDIESWSDNDGINAFYNKGKVVPVAVASLLTQAPTAEQIRQMCPVAVSDLNLDKYGATAISLCAPRNPLADASSTIGELKDGLPHLPSPTGNIGGEYLNVVFGIQPIVSELKDYHSSWLNAEKLLDQLEKDSGKWIRRGFTFDPVRTSEVYTSDIFPTMVHGQTPYAINVDSSARTKREIYETKIWFRGAFTYHLPKSGWRRKLEELDYLYGVKPGVDTAWELMPWSWLVDWYSNVGDVLHNVNAFTADGLVMPYGYIMMTQTRTISWDYTLHYKNSVGVNQTALQMCAVKYTTMQRRQANPFGFGFSWDSLSLRQGAILAALGISRA